jgi:hypothetical protein
MEQCLVSKAQGQLHLTFVLLPQLFINNLIQLLPLPVGWRQLLKLLNYSPPPAPPPCITSDVTNIAHLHACACCGSDSRARGDRTKQNGRLLARRMGKGAVTNSSNLNQL